MPIAQFLDEVPQEKLSEKNKADDRLLELRPADGKIASSTMGNVDTRLFKGGNKLHVKRNRANDLWHFEYENGILPGGLKDKHFTTFKLAKEHAEAYFKNRNIEIVKVVD